MNVPKTFSPVPVIAAVHGVAFGGGLQIMLGADIKYITADTKLSVMEMKWGLIPDMAGTQLMRHSVRDDIIRELTYTNRMLSGAQAVEYGFATHVSDNPMEDAMKLATEIASKSPSAIVKAKRVLNAAPYLSQEDGLLLESVEQDGIINKKNQLAMYGLALSCLVLLVLQFFNYTNTTLTYLVAVLMGEKSAHCCTAVFSVLS